MAHRSRAAHLSFLALLAAARLSAQPQASAGPDSQKTRALEAACSSGLLTPAECAAKRGELAKGNNSQAGVDSGRRTPGSARDCRTGNATSECAARRSPV